MRIAAILSLSEDQQGSGELPSSPILKSHHARELSYIQSEILGQSLLDRTLGKLQQFGIAQHKIISEEVSGQLVSTRSLEADSFGDEWERAVTRYLQEGIDLLVFHRISTYSDLDFMQLVRFHLETENPVTQAHASDGPLDVVLVDASRLRGTEGPYRRSFGALLSQQARFMYRGYVNRLARPQDFYTLVDDGLRGRCALRPIGIESREWVWQGAGAHVDSSAVVSGPAFIGAGASIGAGCKVASGSSIERDCEVDCGTVVEQSWVTQKTYLGAALDVRRAIVAPNRLFHLDRDVEVQIGDRHLIGAAGKSAPMFAGLGSLLWGESGPAN